MPFKESSHIFGKWNFLALILRNFLYSRKRKHRKNFLYFFKRKLSLYFTKRNFLIFRERYIQRPNIFRTRGIFRTVTYLELEAYSEPWFIQNPRHIQNTVKHLRWNVLQKQLPSALSYIPGNEAFLTNISLIFQKATFRAQKVKRNHS